MAGYTVPSQSGNQIPIQTEDRDFLSSLDVVWFNKYEGEIVNPTNATEVEFNFYKGAPPQWLNFYWAEREDSHFVKRDSYTVLQKKINEARTERLSIAHVKLCHEPGSGGSTLVMQMLWDMRKQLRCAKVLDSTTEPRATAQQVLRLFLVGGSKNHNTVLLLLDNKDSTEDPSFQKDLEEKLCDEMNAKGITARIPVVVILNCVRQTNMAETRDNVNLSSDLSARDNWNLYSKLSQREQSDFERKLSDIVQKHGNRYSQLYAFNILRRNFNPSYVKEVCKVLQPLKKNRRPRKQQLLAFLALINAHVPGSDLPLDICQLYFERECKNLDDFSFEEHMQPFTDFLVIFSTKEEGTRSEDLHVRMVHPMIASEVLEMFINAGVTRSDTTLNLLTELSKRDMPPCLIKTIRKLLTKRESRPPKDTVSNGTSDKFSKLILHIKKRENPSMCIAVLKKASKIFKLDPFYPQALARFYYIESGDYERAKDWAKTAICRDEKNSFIRDTLGQVLKNCLKKKRGACVMEILQIGKQATEAFKNAQEAALKQLAPDMYDMSSTSTIFNNRGIFGYMQVARIIFEYLTNSDQDWSKVLTKETNLHRFLDSNDRRKCRKYQSLITSLRDEVEDKFTFFELYLLYSKPSIHKDEPSYFEPEVFECYDKFVIQSKQNKSALQIFKEKKACTFAGLLNTQDRDLELISEQWKEIYLASPGDAQNIQNYIVTQVLLSQRNPTSVALRPLEELQKMLQRLWTEQKDKRSPEFYLLVLLLFWPDEQNNRSNSLDVSECVEYMRQSFERTYKKYLRSRYLNPLFFLNQGQGLQRFVYKSYLPETSLENLRRRHDIPEIQCVRGEVRNSKVFAVQGSNRIEVVPSNPASICGQGQVTFQLGFNIKGAVAYNVRY